MKKKGFTLIELLVVIAIIAMLLAILMPALNKVKKIAQRVVCGTNLKGLGTAQVVYANDYDDAYVVQSHTGNPMWNVSLGGGFANPAKDWTAETQISVGASLYLLVREADVSPKSFICSAGGQTPYEGENGNQLDITELWDFGIWTSTAFSGTGSDNGVNSSHGPKNHVSYSYQMPYGTTGGAGRHAADGTKSAAFAVMADKNPWYDPKLNLGAPDAETWQDGIGLMGAYYSNQTIEKWKIQRANAYSHSREGQNVLFGDGHSSYEKTTDVGVKHDNIFTMALTPVSGSEHPHRRGAQGSGGLYIIDSATMQPYSSNDSFLVNDDFR